MDRGAWWATVHGVAKNQTQTEATQHTTGKALAASSGLKPLISLETEPLNTENKKETIPQITNT